MFVLKDRHTGLYFAGWDTLGDNPWEVRARWVGLRGKARQFIPADEIVDWSNVEELSGCQQVEV